MGVMFELWDPNHTVKACFFGFNCVVKYKTYSIVSVQFVQCRAMGFKRNERE